MTKQGFINRSLSAIETVGNKLPPPAMLFFMLTIFLIVLSVLFSWLDIKVLNPTVQTEETYISVFNLLSAEGIRYIFSSVVSNFVSFAPLGTVLVAFIGVSIAEHSGFISASIRAIIGKSNRATVTTIIVFVGVMSNTAGELGYLVIIPLAGAIFHAMGRHPIAGMAAAFAGVSGGYSANLLLGTVDPLLSGLTQEAAHFINPEYRVGVEANWYFMIASTFLVTSVVTVLSEKIIEPRLGKYQNGDALDSEERALEAQIHLTKIEKKGLFWAVISIVILSLIIIYLVVPEGAILRNQKTGLITNSPFLDSIVFLILLFFAVAGIVYGYTTKNFKNTKDVVNAMDKTFNTLGAYIVLVFFAAQFVAYFKVTNLGTIVAVAGATALESINFTGVSLMISFVVLSAFINLFMGSASAKWSMLAPVFIPMFMLLGYSPELVQVAYRIGDSATNIISPLLSYFALIVAFFQKYDKNSGIGTIVATMLPYSIALLISWSIFLYLWVFLFNLPVGPGVNSFYTV
ncbi:AbgT family transporter [Fastidiosibacter lacustris]|uniref:AbgT family transporter n=1 Tax=Fastidiosibacter lacustris TaxID=2056695 RepID=UPI000E340BFA|nr:AbgT family transporter [Fastidiosibacter lacustris]